MIPLRSWTGRNLLKASEAPGKPARRLAGGWVSDLAALGKAILLCDFCAHKFDPRKYGYERKQAVPGHAFVMGRCDGCRGHNQCSMFLKA